MKERRESSFREKDNGLYLGIASHWVGILFMTDRSVGGGGGVSLMTDSYM